MTHVEMDTAGCKQAFRDLLIGIGIFLYLGQVVNTHPEHTLTQCDSTEDKCYTLYRGDLSWQEAFDSCLTRKQHLATIRDAPTQSIMEQFAADQLYTDPAHVWVAGRRSDDMTWRDVGEAAFNNDDYISGGEHNDRLCTILNGASGSGSDVPKIHAVPCYLTSPRKALCEYNPQGAGCPDDEMTIHQPSVNKCNTVSSQKYKSLYDASLYCQSKGWQLAHTGAGSWDYYKKLSGTDKPLIRHAGSFWIGVQRRTWTWVQGGGKKSPMNITNWRHEEGVHFREGCMHLELNNRGLWADKPCDVTSGYFICEHNTPVPSTSPTSSEGESKPTAAISSDCEYSLWYVITGVVGAVLLLENIVFIIICILRNVNATSMGTSQTLVSSTNFPSTPLDPESVVYEEPVNLVTDDYITTTDGSSVPGHRENEAYSPLDGQTNMTPGLNVPCVIHRNSPQYNVVDSIDATVGSTAPDLSQNEAYPALDGQTNMTTAPSVYETV